MMFKCDQCGCCCRHLDMSEIYTDLDRGDGTCRYLVGNLCSIYDKRPKWCRVEECYDLYFYKFMDRGEYYRLNAEECRKLKNMED